MFVRIEILLTQDLQIEQAQKYIYIQLGTDFKVIIL